MGSKESGKFRERKDREGDRSPVREDVVGHEIESADTAPGDTAAEQAEGAQDVDGHVFGTNPYMMEKTAEARRQDFMSEAERARQAGKADGGRGLGERLRDRVRGRDHE